MFNGKLITVWSAPHYCAKFFNLASILEIDENMNKHFNVFEDYERQVSDDELKKKQLVQSVSDFEKYFK